MLPGAFPGAEGAVYGNNATFDILVSEPFLSISGTIHESGIVRFVDQM
jgi:hypothetical protein